MNNTITTVTIAALAAVLTGAQLQAHTWDEGCSRTLQNTYGIHKAGKMASFSSPSPMQLQQNVQTSFGEARSSKKEIIMTRAKIKLLKEDIRRSEQKMKENQKQLEEIGETIEWALSEENFGETQGGLPGYRQQRQEISKSVAELVRQHNEILTAQENLEQSVRNTHYEIWDLEYFLESSQVSSVKAVEIKTSPSPIIHRDYGCHRHGHGAGCCP